MLTNSSALLKAVVHGPLMIVEFYGNEYRPYQII